MNQEQGPWDKEISQVAHSLTQFEGMRAKMLAKREQIVKIWDLDICPRIEQGWLCFGSEARFDSVCCGNYESCTGYAGAHSSLMTDELIKYADKVQ